MKSRRSSTLFAVSCLVAGPLLAQPSPASEKACALLRPAEIEAAVGAKLDRPLAGMEVPVKKDAAHPAGERLWTCEGQAGSRAVTVFYGTEPATPEGKVQAQARVKAPRERLRGMGYTVKETRLGATTCWTLTPPAAHGDEPVAFGTTCGGVKGRSFYSVSVSSTGAGDLLGAEKVKALADRAAARLP
jgi:hypothetical protein